MRQRIPTGQPAAIACTLAAVACFASLDTTTKVLASAVPVVVVIWFRYLFQMLLTLATTRPARRRRLLHSRRPGLQVLRGALLVSASAMAFYSLKFMPVAEFTAVVTLTPLLVTLLAVWRLGERVTPLEWALVLGGMAGALVVIRPTHDLFHWATLLPAALVLVNAVFQMLTRRLAEVDDSATTQFYTGCVGAGLSSLLLPWAWEMPPDLRAWGLLALLCVLGAVGHLLLIMAYARAPVATLTPFLYGQIVFATIAGWLVFGQVPDALAFGGMALVGLCGSLGTWLAGRQIAPAVGPRGRGPAMLAAHMNDAAPDKTPTPARRPRKAKTADTTDTPVALEPGRTNDPEATMANILDVATTEFSEKGLAGARIDEIAALTRTSKRMIYYYFGNKEGLYIAVLEEAYRRIRHIETDLHLEDLDPEAALRKLVAFTCDYQRANPEFIRLVMNENMHRGEFLARSESIQKLNVPAINGLRLVYERGVAAGVFRPDIDPVDLHMSISALSVFNVANRHTFALIFKHDFDDSSSIAARRDSIVEMVVRFVRQ